MTTAPTTPWGAGQEEGAVFGHGRPRADAGAPALPRTTHAHVAAWRKSATAFNCTALICTAAS